MIKLTLLDQFRHRRRSRLRQSLLLDVNLRARMRLLVSYFLVLLSLHVAAMVGFESMPLSDAVWMTLTTVTTVGYGDLSAQTLWGRAATVLLMYFGGIFILAKIAGDYFDFRLERRAKMLKGEWSWHMKKHIVIINAPRSNAAQYFERLINQFRQIRDFREVPVQLLTDRYPEGLPPALRNMDVLHYHGGADDPLNLQAVDVADAAYVVVLARDESDRLSDSFTFDILHRLRELGACGNVLVECVDDINRQRFYEAGAHSVIRPIRAYPELIVRAIAAPGAEKVLENLFTHGGNHTRRYDVTLTKRTWAQVASALLEAGLGTALAYIEKNGEVNLSPDPHQPFSAIGLILLVREERVPTVAEMESVLQ